MRTFAAVAVLASASAVAQAETCSMYQKFVKDQTGILCANQGTRFREVTAVGGNGTFYARKVPKCDATGTDTGCLATTFVRSLDGTRAYYHVDPVPGSKNWVFFFEGGQACGKMLGLNAAEACYAGGTDIPFDPYNANAGDAFEMTTQHASGAFTVKERKTGKGILSTDALNPYASYNRVWINKSSFDRFMGSTNNTKAVGADDVELYFHGRHIIRSVVKDLDRANGVICVGGQEGEEICSGEKVPDLSDAEVILFVGESGGAGGLIHNAQWLKTRIDNVSPSIKVNFVASSRMLPWLEAEAFFGGTGSIWDDVYSGATGVDSNPMTPGPATVDVTYSSATYEGGGAIRELLSSWGDPASATDLYLDASCKADHGNGDWRCFDEGHVALYHTDENMFFFESLRDDVHSDERSPVFWMETGDFGNGPIVLDPGFIWDPPGTFIYTQDRAERVLYTIDQILLDTSHRGARGFYSPWLKAHGQVTETGFWSATLDCPTGLHTWSLANTLQEWENENNLGLCPAPGCDVAAVEDTLATYKITYVDGHNGGGWTP
jgi:hypothetical protein